MQTLRLVRDAAFVAVVAVLTVQALRRWCGDRYLVPSDSMQPVLYGDPVHGDVVFVDKTASAAGRRRGDLVVVEHPSEKAHQLVKRIAASGDDPEACCIDIRGGDLWLGPDRQNVALEVKDPLAARRVQVPWAALGDERLGLATVAAPGLADLRTVLREDSLLARQRRAILDPAAGRPIPDGTCGTLRPVDATYLDRRGERSRTGVDSNVRDASLAIELREPATAEWLLTVETPGEALSLHVRPADGAVVLWRNGVDVETGTLPPGPVRSLEFGLLDNRVWVSLDDTSHDGARERLFVAARRREWTVVPAGDLPPGFRTHLHAAVPGAEPPAITTLRVGRDVYHDRERVAALVGRPGDWPRTVPGGHWFLLGDNCFDSRDSRQFGPVPVTSFLGVPRCVLGPWSRRRWLEP